MQTIHKYPLQVTDVQEVEIPRFGEILSVQNQNGQICVWALVDTGMPKSTRRFRIYGTGKPANINSPLVKFIGTVQVDEMEGTYVWHVFVENERI